MKFILPLLAMSISALCFCQAQNVSKYYNEKWQAVATRDEAYYYRTVEEISGMYLVTDYDVSTDKKARESVCTEIYPDIVREGESKWYYPNGNVKEEGFFKENRRNGIFKSYYDNGAIHSITCHYAEFNLKTKYFQFWTESGASLLNHGTGLIYRDNLIDNFDFMDIKDSLLVASYSVKPEADTVYWVAENAAEFNGGMKAFYEGVGKALAGKYPKLARQDGIEGRVFIEFSVDKNGRMIDEKVIKGIGGGCDELAVESFAKLKKWKPATYKGRPVKTKMVLPVVFRLN